MITAVFDLDGTIADTLHDIADAVNYGLEKLGCPVHSYEKYKKFVGNGAGVLCERALPDDRKSESGELLKIFKDFYSKHYLEKTEIYPDIRECLKRLSENGVTLAIATNKPEDTAIKIISELLPQIDFVKILGGCEERPKKPDPAIIREILKDLPEENTVFMIGDSNVDIETAKNSGIISIGCAWGFRGIRELKNAGADYIAEKVSDIADIILDFGRNLR